MNNSVRTQQQQQQQKAKAEAEEEEAEVCRRLVVCCVTLPTDSDLICQFAH